MIAERLREHAVRYANDYGYNVASDLNAAAAHVEKLEAALAANDAVARLSRELVIELDTYWSGTSGPSLSGIMLDWRNKYKILLEDGE